MASKRKKTRPRGGATVLCSECGSPSHVLTTRRDPSGAVVRHRQCVRYKRHRFFTSEQHDQEATRGTAEIG